jgi:hypothetical protein
MVAGVASRTGREQKKHCTQNGNGNDEGVGSLTVRKAQITQVRTQLALSEVEGSAPRSAASALVECVRGSIPPAC